ncbi:MAG: universal stress protein [Rhodospirillales bacterium]|nr:universal stress protein [Rhodospirillales bacterium]
MSYKIILTPIDGGEACKRALSVAMNIARQCDSHIQAIHVKADSKEAVPLLGEGMSGSMIEEMINLADRDADDRAAVAHKMFDDFCSANNVSVTDKPDCTGGASMSWLQEEGREDERVANRGRVVDLIVMAQPANDTSQPSLLTLHAAIFETGRPVLMVPENSSGDIGKNAVIAWNGTSEAARAVAGGIPLLATADKVTVLTAETEKSVTRIGGEELATYLKCHGITAKCEHVSPGAKSVGEAITDYCNDNGCDLLVTGAFTHSRLVQIILGGVTRHIISNAKIPVLMIH